MSPLALSASFEYLCYWSTAINIFLFLVRVGHRIYTSESDVYRRLILTSKDGPRGERVNILVCKPHVFFVIFVSITE